MLQRCWATRLRRWKSTTRPSFGSFASAFVEFWKSGTGLEELAVMAPEAPQADLKKPN